MKTGILVLLVFASSFCGISEKDALIYALSHNSDIILSYSKISNDSLSLCAVKSGWLPEISISLSPQVMAMDSGITLSSGKLLDSTSALFLQNTVKLSQPIIGGGILSTSYGNTSNRMINSNNSSFSNSLQFTYSQPLLNSAWKFSELYYGISIQTLDNTQSSLEETKSILSTLSDIRTFYWDYYQQKLYRETYRREVARNLDLLKATRSKFALGEASVFDTLNDSYNYTDAQQKLLDAEIASNQARDKLALALSLPTDSIDIKDSLLIVIPDLPDPQTFISLATRYDQSLKIFETVSEKLKLQHRKICNSLLPSLDATASVSFNRSGESYFSNDEFGNNAVVGLILSYEFPKRKIIISRKQNELEMKDNSVSREKYHNELMVKIMELRESWGQEKQRIVLSEKSKEIAELQFRAAQKEYNMGTIERLTLTDSQNKLVNSENELTRNRIEMKKLEIMFDEITGTLLQRFNLAVIH